MDDRIPATVGVVVCLAVVVVVVGPLLVVSAQDATSLSTYYGSGVVGGWGVAVIALVCLVAFAGGRQRRTDPGTAAGATVAMGVGMALLAAEWALSVDPELLQSSTSAAWMAYHRWVVAALSLSVPVVAGWFARALGLAWLPE